MYLLFDIGGTKMRFAVSPDLRHINAPVIMPTSDTVDEMIEVLKRELPKMTDNQPIKAVAGGVAGALSHDRRVLIKSPNKPTWDNQPIADRLGDLLNVPVFIENDAAIVGLGEALSGPGIGKKIVAYVTVSTGVGGARIVNGKIEPSHFGFEPGHQIISVGEKEDGSPVFGYLEDFISGKALEKAYGKPAAEINEEQIWDDVAFFLGIGLNNIIVHWSPDIIVLGGAVAQKIDIEQLQKYIQQNLRIFPEMPEIVKAKLDDIGGLYGALEFLKQKYIQH